MQGDQNRHPIRVPYLTTEPFENRNKQPRCIKNENGPLTTSTLCEKIKKRKVFNASIWDEMTGFRFELWEGSQEFFVLKTIYESLQKKGDADKFYSNFYKDKAANAPRYFKGLTQNAATLLPIKVADSIILFW